MEEDLDHGAFVGSLLTCSGCGRNFMQSNAYSNHVGRCQRGIKRNAGALEVAQEMYRMKKRLRSNAVSQSQTIQQVPELAVKVSLRNHSLSMYADYDIISKAEQVLDTAEVDLEAEAHICVEPEAEASLSLAQGRTRRQNIQAPERYRPTALSSLPPVSENAANPQNAVYPQNTANPLRQILKSRSNVFGLFRQYRAVSFPPMTRRQI
jgi:uncharacterized C2H2 Zn-finger protein